MVVGKERKEKGDLRRGGDRKIENEKERRVGYVEMKDCVGVGQAIKQAAPGGLIAQLGSLFEFLEGAHASDPNGPDRARRTSRPRRRGAS